jgi:hypothetical protein
MASRIGRVQRQAIGERVLGGLLSQRVEIVHGGL